jgi:uncharacterized membrane protein (DUF2068 family)
MSARPLPVTVAVVLLVILSLGNLLSPVMPSEGVPTFVVYLGVVLGVLGLIGALGLWMLKRWALWLTIVVSVLNILSAAPGLAFAPTPTLKVLATIGVVGFAVVILLAILPGPRRTYT